MRMTAIPTASSDMLRQTFSQPVTDMKSLRRSCERMFDEKGATAWKHLPRSQRSIYRKSRFSVCKALYRKTRRKMKRKSIYNNAATSVLEDQYLRSLGEAIRFHDTQTPLEYARHIEEDPDLKLTNAQKLGYDQERRKTVATTKQMYNTHLRKLQKQALTHKDNFVKRFKNQYTAVASDRRFSPAMVSSPEILPCPDVLDTLTDYVPCALPVPNLGYACLNTELRAMKPPIFTNRNCVKKTYEAKGISHISSLALQNTRDLAGVIQWNQDHNIRFFRMSSAIFPWCSEYNLTDLPDYDGIKQNLEFAGALARVYNQRLTFHPSCFVCLASPKPEVVTKGMQELEIHSATLDLMGYEPSPYNKCNIHISGVYGDKEAALNRFAESFGKLSANCRARLTLENDDQPGSYSVDDLLPFVRRIGVPLVFDLHHQRFCKGVLSDKDAMEAALATWPEGIRPVIHWSESQEGRKPLAHSDFVEGPLDLYGHEAEVDIMIEAKAKEQALLRYRDVIMPRLQNSKKE